VSVIVTTCECEQVVVEVFDFESVKNAIAQADRFFNVMPEVR
jgi:hypothetical protein